MDRRGIFRGLRKDQSENDSRLCKKLGILAKTDKLDAQIIARFARERSPQPQELPDETKQQLQAMLIWRRQLVEHHTRIVSQKRLIRSPMVLAQQDQLLKEIDQNIKTLDKEIDKQIKDDPELKKRDELLQSVPGVGPVLSRTLITECAMLGSCNSREIASYVGTAPFNYDSGKMRGTRHIRGGCASIRRVLYMATLRAVHGCNPILTEYFQSLLARGKKFKVAMTACMRKLITILNTLVKNNTPWIDQTTFVSVHENLYVKRDVCNSGKIRSDWIGRVFCVVQLIGQAAA